MGGHSEYDIIGMLIYATADEADAYVLQIFFCFFPFFVFFWFFSVRHKNTRQPFSERLNGFS